MDQYTLECFVAVADSSSFSKAAEKLFMTQPSLSRRIAALEKEVGAALVIRSKPIIQLTPKGAEMLLTARRILGLYNELYDSFSAQQTGSMGRLRIGYLNLSQFYILCDAASTLRSELSQVDFFIHRNTIPQLYKMLYQGNLDVIFDRCHASHHKKELESRPLPEGTLYAVVPRGHRLQDRPEIDLSELSGESFVMFERSTAPVAFDNSVNLCVNQGFSMDIAAYGANMEEVLLQVGVGNGVTLMDEAAKVMATKYTIFIPIRNQMVQNSWYVIWLKSNSNPLIPQFIRLATEQSEPFPVI